MISLMYTSSASHLMSSGELLSLLEEARQRNLKQDITGILLYLDGNFIQILEGESPDVEDIYASIEKDGRNKGNIIIMKEDIPFRSFPDWAMGFRELSKQEMEKLSGTTDFLFRDSSREIPQSVHPVISTLLYRFKQNSNGSLANWLGVR